MLLTEIQLVEWFEAMTRSFLTQSDSANQTQVQISCYRAAREVKIAYHSDNLEAIDSYLKNFLFIDFKEIFSADSFCVERK